MQYAIGCTDERGDELVAYGISLRLLFFLRRASQKLRRSTPSVVKPSSFDVECPKPRISTPSFVKTSSRRGCLHANRRKGLGVYTQRRIISVFTRREASGARLHTKAYRWPSEVLVGSGRGSALKVVHRGDHHIRVFRADDSLHDVELPAAPVAAHASAVAPVLCRTQHLRHREKRALVKVQN